MVGLAGNLFDRLAIFFRRADEVERHFSDRYIIRLPNAPS